MVSRLGDRYIRFSAPVPEGAARTPTALEPPLATGELLAGPVAFVRLPHLVGGGPHARAYAETLQAWIRRLDGHGPRGWFVELTGSGGGNMWPMRAGIGPLLGEGEVGRFVHADGVATSFAYREGRAMEGAAERARVDRPYALARPGPPVAVLTGPATASSGEAIAAAFRGRAKSRSFGRPTAGLSTGNADYTLGNGAVLTLTEVVPADRGGTPYGRALEPDEPARWLGPTAQERALAWLHAHGACAMAPRDGPPIRDERSSEWS